MPDDRRGRMPALGCHGLIGPGDQKVQGFDWFVGNKAEHVCAAPKEVAET